MLRESEIERMLESHNLIQQELTLFAKRLGLSFESEDLESATHAYLRSRELFDQLRQALVPEEEPAIIFVRSLKRNQR